MKYCVDYSKGLPIAKEIDELVITFNPGDKSLVDFIELHKEQRIIIFIENNLFLTKENFELFKSLYELYKNIVIKFTHYQEDMIEEILQYNFPFFFGDRVNNWDTLIGLISLGVSDVYVVEELCFEIDKVAEVAHSEGVNIRVFPNVAQSAWKDSDGITKFFIRPEDVYLYEPYVDVLEFFNSKKRENTLYKIYAIEKKWFGQLNELIIGLNDDIDSRYILPEFALHRIFCGKKCIKTGKCRICHKIKTLSHTLKDNNYIIKKK